MTTPEEPARQRTGLTAGYRPCAQCGFSLEGQPIEREPHYKLLLVFCPECGAPSPVLEYPVLSPWARRLGTLCFAIWALVMIAMFAATVASQTGLSFGLLEQTRYSTAIGISTEHASWYNSSGEAERIAALPAGNTGFNGAQFNSQVVPGNPYGPVNDTWWANQLKAGAPITNPTWNIGTLLGPAAAILFGSLLSGALFATALPGARSWRLLVIPILAPLAALVFAALLRLQSFAIAGYYWGWSAASITGYTRSAMQTANEICPTSFMYIAVAGALIAGCIGALLGRPLARLTARFLIPPRRLHLLQFLWSADNLPLPKQPK